MSERGSGMGEQDRVGSGPDVGLSATLVGEHPVPIWQVERDRFGLHFSGPLEVGEMLHVVPLEALNAADNRTWAEMLSMFISDFWTCESVTRSSGDRWWSWDIEALGPYGYNATAGGWADTKWGARRKLRKHRRRMRDECWEAARVR